MRAGSRRLGYVAVSPTDHLSRLGNVRECAIGTPLYSFAPASHAASSAGEPCVTVRATLVVGGAGRDVVGEVDLAEAWLHAVTSRPAASAQETRCTPSRRCQRDVSSTRPKCRSGTLLASYLGSRASRTAGRDRSRIWVSERATCAR